MFFSRPQPRPGGATPNLTDAAPPGDAGDGDRADGDPGTALGGLASRDDHVHPVRTLLYACDPLDALAVGEAVAMAPGELGARVVWRAQADDVQRLPMLGLVHARPSATTARVQYSGPFGGFAGLTPGATLYLDVVPGGLTQDPGSFPPGPPLAVVQRVGYAKNATTVVLQVHRGYAIPGG